MDRVQINAQAKANLFLRVLSREDSGYHNIETLLTLLELHDSITVERINDGIELDVTGADTGPMEENLVYRAAKIVLDATGKKFGVRIHLEKRIPVQAGLGGGSSDGAAALHAVNRLTNDSVPRYEILQFGAKLGSDIPFFVSGASLAVGWGRGERLFRLPAPKSSPVLLAVPGFGISTQNAYSLVAGASGQPTRRGAVVFDQEAFQTWGAIGRLGGNDFETPLFGKEQRLRDLFEHIAETRPLLARLTGSGSAVIGVYKNERDRDGAALQIGERDWRLIKTMTREHPAPGPVEC